MYKKSNKLKFILLLGGSLLFCSMKTYGVKVVDLPETPLGAYEEKRLPLVRSLPKQYFLAMTPVKDQGPLGTCTSFSVSACGEYHNPARKLSEAEFTILVETQLSPEDAGNCKPGMYLGKALQVGQRYGLTDESKFPYEGYLKYVAQKNGIISYNWRRELEQITNPDICIKNYKFTGLFKMEPDPKESYNKTMTEIGSSLRLYGTTDDIGYRLGNLYPIHHVSKTSLAKALRNEETRSEKGSIGLPTRADIESVKKALYCGFPVAAALPIFEGCWDDGVQIKMPYKDSKYTGSHAVVLTGFDDTSKMFRVKNSWGQNWGQSGYGNIPYDYVGWYALELIGVGKK